MTALWIAVGVLTVAILFLGFALGGAVRRIDELRREARSGAQADIDHPSSGVPVGAGAPVIDAPRLDGEAFTSASLRGRRHLVVFAEPGCAACHDLIPELVRATDLPPTIMVSGPGDDAPWPDAWRPAPGASITVVVRDAGGAVARAYDTGFTPHVFVVDEAGWVAAQGAAGALADVRQLLREADAIRIVHAEPGGG